MEAIVIDGGGNGNTGSIGSGGTGGVAAADRPVLAAPGVEVADRRVPSTQVEEELADQRAPAAPGLKVADRRVPSTRVKEESADRRAPTALREKQAATADLLVLVGRLVKAHKEDEDLIR